MEMNANVRESPDASAEECAPHELILRILKLRWLGMENEAERMQDALNRVDSGCTLQAGPFDTD